jgi:hypothetical protein
VRPVVEAVRGEAGQQPLQEFIVEGDDAVQEIAAMASRW